VGEVFDPNQVGSSTMPHKRNPWNFENVKSFWKAFMPRMVTAYADQLSEHQRDLTNSATERFLMELVVAFTCVVRRLRRVMRRLVTDRERMRANFEMSADMVIAEPAYILLAAAGHPDAHEAARQLTLTCEQTGKPLVEFVHALIEMEPYWERLTEEQRAVLSDPERYVGIAAEKTERLCREWGERLELGPD
jgi:adenylosuccinate lyase